MQSLKLGVPRTHRLSSSEAMGPIPYRPDIDGLRGIAVLAVVLFHVGVPGMTGGYVGVDVFFVISGFLITQIVQKQVSNHTFTYTQFYLRRMRRLFPALAATLIVTFGISMFFLPPLEFRENAAATLSSLLSVSNFWFWSQLGYFDIDSQVKPLLHTWSLSVEEQFYLAWPACIVFLSTKLRLVRIAVIGGASVASVLLSQWWLSIDAAAVFYLTPFRIAEFGLGALIAKREATNKLPDILSLILVLVWLALILFPVFLYDETTDFPGINSLPPCIGAAMCIYCGDGKYSRIVLGNLPLVAIGIISYSLYLVHWPVHVFTSIGISGQIQPWLQASLEFGLSVALGTASYLFIEKRFRHSYGRWTGSSRTFLLGSGVTGLLVFSVALGAFLGNGWAWRLPPDVRSAMTYDKSKLDDYVWREFNDRRWKPSPSDPGWSTSSVPRVLIVGDSQAGDFVNILLASDVSNQVSIRTLEISAACQPILPSQDDAVDEFIKPDYRDACKRARKRFVEDVGAASADLIVIASSWREWGLPYLEETLQKLKTITSARIAVLAGKRMRSSGPQVLTTLNEFRELASYTASTLHPDTLRTNAALSTSPNALYLDLLEVFCSPDYGSCRVFTDDGKIIFYDASHVTPWGAKFLGHSMDRSSAFSRFFRDLLAETPPEMSTSE